jgi:hypothetical protein
VMEEVALAEGTTRAKADGIVDRVLAGTETTAVAGWTKGAFAPDEILSTAEAGATRSALDVIVGDNFEPHAPDI